MSKIFQVIQRHNFLQRQQKIHKERENLQKLHKANDWNWNAFIQFTNYNSLRLGCVFRVGVGSKEIHMFAVVHLYRYLHCQLANSLVKHKVVVCLYKYLFNNHFSHITFTSYGNNFFFKVLCIYHSSLKRNLFNIWFW